MIQDNPRESLVLFSNLRDHAQDKEMTHITPMLKRCFRAGLWFALLITLGACTLTQGDYVAGIPTVEESPSKEPPRRVTSR